MNSLCTTSLTQLAYLAASVQPSWLVWKFLLIVFFSSWVGGLLVSGCCPSLYVTLWIIHGSHAVQGSAKQNLFPFVGCSHGFRFKALWSKPFLSFTKRFLHGRIQWNLWRVPSSRRQLRASNRFTWLTNVPKMFGYKIEGCKSQYVVRLRNS